MEYTQNFYRNYNIKIKALVKICRQYMKSPLCYEVRSCEFPLRTGAISLFSSTTLPMPVLFMWEERAGEFLLRTVTALFFSCLLLLHYYYFYVGRRGLRQTFSLRHALLPAESKYCRMQEESHSLRRRNSSDLPPPPRIASCREFTSTIECKKAMMMCVAGIRQT